LPTYKGHLLKYEHILTGRMIGIIVFFKRELLTLYVMKNNNNPKN